MSASTHPLSVRVSPLCDAYVKRTARRRKRSQGSIFRELADEAIKMRLFPGVIFMGPDDDRRASISGTGWDIWQIIEAYKDYGHPESCLRITAV